MAQGRFDRQISIHALREEGDTPWQATPPAAPYFYPRPPRGGRLLVPSRALYRTWKFLSTPSARRATRRQHRAPGVPGISIHALREEGDMMIEDSYACRKDFYPRPPRGGRLPSRCSLHSGLVFLSTPSARRATGLLIAPTRCLCNFYPRPPRGGRPVRQCSRVSLRIFLSTPSARRATCRPLLP